MRFYFNHRRFLDLLIAVAASLCVHYQPFLALNVFRQPTGASFDALMLAIAATGATLTGFVLAASTFLVSQTAGDRFTILRESAGYAQLLQIIRSSLWRLTLLSAVAGLCAVVKPEYHRETALLLTFLLTHSLMSILTLTWCTLSILSISTD